jgi:hypothetical protein
LNSGGKKEGALCALGDVNTIGNLMATTLYGRFESRAYIIIFGFMSRSRIFHLYGDVTIAGEGLQNLGLCSALRAFEQGRIFILPHLL